MAVKYQDYYETLGVPRNATQEQIHAAYRKLARKYHPDINKSSDAEDRFKRIGEAHEVLRDPEKRKRYDALGDNWKAGQDFTPPPGWDFFNFGAGTRPGTRSRSGGRSGTGADGQGFGFRIFDGFGDSPFSGFSDFFETLFGGGGPGGFGGGGSFGQDQARAQTLRGQDQEAEITIPLEEAYKGTKRSLTLESVDAGTGRPMGESKTLEVKIPAGTSDGQRLRLRGQGGPTAGGGTPGGGTPGDLYLRVRIAPHPIFRLNGADLELDAPVSPWEAALGAHIDVPIIGGRASVKLQPGTQSGRRLRLRGKGFPKKSGGHGDLYVRIRIEVPKHLSDRERQLFEELSKSSAFQPRRW
jgi:curved DNA-binding protein